MTESTDRIFDQSIIFASATRPECNICASSGLASGESRGPVFMQTGIGISDPARLSEQIMNSGASGLISIGTAGGLMPDLRPGALLLPNQVLNSNGAKFAADSQWHARVHTALEITDRVHTEDLLSVNRVVRYPDQKKALHRETRAFGVDMESAGLAAIAAKAGLPFVILRVVMDTAGDEIPKAATISVSESGDTQSVALLRYLAGHMSEIPGLLRTMSRFRDAATSLREACRLAGRELLCPR